MSQAEEGPGQTGVLWGAGCAEGVQMGLLEPPCSPPYTCQRSHSGGEGEGLLLGFEDTALPASQ